MYILLLVLSFLPCTHGQDNGVYFFKHGGAKKAANLDHHLNTLETAVKFLETHPNLAKTVSLEIGYGNEKDGNRNVETWYLLIVSGTASSEKRDSSSEKKQSSSEKKKSSRGEIESLSVKNDSSSETNEKVEKKPRPIVLVFHQKERQLEYKYPNGKIRKVALDSKRVENDAYYRAETNEIYWISGSLTNMYYIGCTWAAPASSNQRYWKHDKKNSNKKKITVKKNLPVVNLRYFGQTRVVQTTENVVLFDTFEVLASGANICSFTLVQNNGRDSDFFYSKATNGQCFGTIIHEIHHKIIGGNSNLLKEVKGVKGFQAVRYKNELTVFLCCSVPKMIKVDPKSGPLGSKLVTVLKNRVLCDDIAVYEDNLYVLIKLKQKVTTYNIESGEQVDHFDLLRKERDKGRRTLQVSRKPEPMIIILHQNEGQVEYKYPNKGIRMVDIKHLIQLHHLEKVYFQAQEDEICWINGVITHMTYYTMSLENPSSIQKRTYPLSSTKNKLTIKKNEHVVKFVYWGQSKIVQTTNNLLYTHYKTNEVLATGANICLFSLIHVGGDSDFFYCKAAGGQCLDNTNHEVYHKKIGGTTRLLATVKGITGFQAVLYGGDNVLFMCAEVPKMLNVNKGKELVNVLKTRVLCDDIAVYEDMIYVLIKGKQMVETYYIGTGIKINQLALKRKIKSEGRRIIQAFNMVA